MAVDDLKLGWQSTIELCDANDGLFTPSSTIGGFTSGTLTISRTNPDSTNIDTGGFQGREYGIKGLTLSAEMLDDQATDTFQITALDDYRDGVKRYLRVRPRVETGAEQFVFKGVWQNAAYTLEQGGIVRFTMNVESDGTITQTSQT